MSAYDDSTSSSPTVRGHGDYPPIAPRPKLAPRSSAASLASATSDAGSRRPLTATHALAAAVLDSSSSSVESLTSAASSRGQQALSGASLSAPLEDSSPPTAAPRNSLRASESAPPKHEKVSAPGGRTVRTLYACVAEHETELSFEPNQVITSGKIHNE